MIFSLVILCHNCEHHINKLLSTIESLSISNDYDYEIIFICSKNNDDETISNLVEYKDKHDKVSYLQIENTGGMISQCRNIGIELCHGDYIWFLDSDDWIMDSDSLKYFYEYLSTNSVDILNFDFFMNKQVCKNNYSIGQIYGVIWSRIFSNNFLMYNKFNNELKTGEDGDFVNRNFKNAKKIGYLPKCLYHYNYPRKDSLCYNIYTNNGYWNKDNIIFDEEGK